MPFTVADYIIKRLQERNVKTLFGVPAFYCFPLFKAALAARMETVVDSSDLGAGYAADGYARAIGLSAVSVAYGVGTLSLLNPIAGGYVERSPIVVVNGGPGRQHLRALRNFDVLFSHSIGKESTDFDLFKEVTAAAVRVAEASQAPALVDAALATAIVKKRPVYIEVASDIWNDACSMPGTRIDPPIPPVGTEAAQAVRILALIRNARSPVVLVGVEAQRYGLADEVVSLLAKLNVKWGSTLLGKAAISEQTRNFIGVYSGRNSRPNVEREVEDADLLIVLGCVLPTGFATLVESKYEQMVHVYDSRVRIGREKADGEIGALVRALSTAAGSAPTATIAVPETPAAVSAPVDSGLTHDEVFRIVNASLDDSLLVIADTFLGIHAASNLEVKGKNAFLCGAAWSSIGHSVGAATGASFGPRRPLVICGDGGFQMTAQSLSTMAQYKRNPIVVLIRNGLYGYEQYLIERRYFSSQDHPLPYVVLNQWDYAKLAGALGIRSAVSVDTVAAFRSALVAAKQSREAAFISVAVKSRDLPAVLPR